eukprot:CAMPEP_0206484042 /NCGR_PEP_ID=MMETSP0324_2-20121206/39760_1 /ASSEMBLY_ACC=CAM_ASM_000836 /TAXON_ID=2866 /ORGANISM="Crypthecodinium cohnii, Strain Seligo" /LENGTH=69 /DNA_ID=CAMNT_0053962157 /DNA_START=108 /DNA_END=314 /DNA_ORIENTATION=-
METNPQKWEDEKVWEKLLLRLQLAVASDWAQAALSLLAHRLSGSDDLKDDQSMVEKSRLFQLRGLSWLG